MEKGREQQDLSMAQLGSSGNLAALEEIHSAYHSFLLQMLVSRGAGLAESEDIVSEIWAACVAGPSKPGLLEKFNGRSTLRSWLATIATNRLIDRRRSAAAKTSAPLDQVSEAEIGLSSTFASASSRSEPALIGLLQNSLGVGFGELSSEAQVIFRLVFVNGLTRREIARMWGWDESKVSRYVSRNSELVRNKTLEELKKADPWLQLEWGDFVDLCATCNAESWMGWNSVQV